MTKEEIYEEFFNVVKDSTEWGRDQESYKYGNYIDGAVDMVRVLLNAIGKKDIK